jgi:outer membrane protein assembly factor BamB
MKQIHLVGLLVVFSVFLFSLILVPLTNADNWPTYRYDSTHTGFSPSTAPTTNSTLWTFQAGPFQYASPTVVDGAIYFACNDQHIYAVNESTGTKIWSFTTQANVGESSPAYANGIIYVGSYDCRLYALNATTGKQIWNYTTGGDVVSSPAVAYGKVYVGSWDKNVSALDAATGAAVWFYTTGGIVMSSPAVADGMVFIGSGDGNVYAFNADTGLIIWNYATGGGVFSSPSVVGGKVYVGSNDGYFYALTENTGLQVWNQSTGTNGGGLSSPAVAYGNVYIGSNDHKVYAFNAATGAQIWNYTTGGYVISAPAVADNTVFIGSYDGNFYALNAATGTKIWTYTSGNGGQFDSSPTVVDGKVFIGSPGGVLVAFGAPQAPSASITPASWTMDVGQSKVFTANPVGGSGSYLSYQWYIGGVAQSGSTSSTFNYVPASAGSPLITVTVTDSLGATSAQSIAPPVTVNVAPTVSISPSSWAMDVGQSKLFAASASGGSGTYSSYQWYLDSTLQTGQTASTFSYSPGSAGSHSITVTVTDSLAATSAQSLAAVVSINSNPTVSVSPYSWNMDIGQSKTFTAITGGGSLSYSYAWFVDYVAQSGTSSSFVFTSSTLGSHTVSVTVTDSVGGQVGSYTTVTVYSVLVAPTVTASPSIVDQGQTSTLSSSTITTGSSPYTYQWLSEAPGAFTYSSISGATSSSYNFVTSTSTTSGSWNFVIQVTDNGGASVSSTPVSVTVNALAATPTPVPTAAPTATPVHTPAPTPRPTSSPTPLPTASPTPTTSPSETSSTGTAAWMSTTMIIVIVIIVVAVLLLLLFLFGWKRGKKKIVASAGANGTISPNGTVQVKSGSDQTFTISANAKFYISDVEVDGKSIGAKPSYTFSNIKDDHTIAAIFEPD